MREEKRGEASPVDVFIGVSGAAYWLWLEPSITPIMMLFTGAVVVLVMALVDYIFVPLLASAWRSWRRI